jgi:Recombinase zinc beta ribbon domain
MTGYCWASRAHLTWDQFLGNQERLLQNHQACGGAERKAGPARAGPALLQGLVLCGKCGRAMTLRYHHRLGRLTPDYVCAKTHVEKGEPVCQHIPGGQIDADVGHLLVQSVTPLALEVALNAPTICAAAPNASGQGLDKRQTNCSPNWLPAQFSPLLAPTRITPRYTTKRQGRISLRTAAGR